MIDVNPTHRETVTRILAAHVPECEVRAFGSRVTWTAKDYSDLDLAVVCDRALDPDVLRHLREAFETSVLPFRVDVLDWHAISAAFQKVIERKYEVVQKGEKKSFSGVKDEWVPVRLGDVTDLLTGFPFGSDRYVNDDSAPRLLRGDNVAQGTLRWDGAKRWPSDSVDDVGTYLLCEGDVILAMDRPWIEAGLKYASVRRSDLPSLLVQRVARLRGTNRLDTRFLKYVVGSQAFTEHVLAVVTGTAVPHISGGDIKNFKFQLPPLPSQRAIAHILGTLDDKIELNRRMNETLEAMARALFKSWFVDFDPVRAKAEGLDRGMPKPLADLFPDSLRDSELGEIPTGWEVGQLLDFAVLNPESWTRQSRPASVHYVDLSNTKWGRIESVATYALRDAPSRAQRVLRPGDTLVGTVRPGNRSYALVSDEGLTGSTGFAALRPRRPEYREFVYLVATTVENIEALAHLADGGAYPAVRPEVVASTKVVRAPDSVVAAFSKAASQPLLRMAANERESRILANLRDTLLPRLISGELRVENAERSVAEATV